MNESVKEICEGLKQIDADEFPIVSGAVALIEELWDKMRNCENCKHKGQRWICDWCADRDRWEFDG